MINKYFKNDLYSSNEQKKFKCAKKIVQMSKKNSSNEQTIVQMSKK